MSENTTFRQIKLVSSVIPRFSVIFTGELISYIILMIQGYFQGYLQGYFQGYFQGQKLNLNVRITKKYKKIGKCKLEQE